MNFITVTAIFLVLIVGVHLLSDKESKGKGGLIIGLAVSVLLFSIIGWAQIEHVVSIISLAFHK